MFEHFRKCAVLKMWNVHLPLSNFYMRHCVRPYSLGRLRSLAVSGFIVRYISDLNVLHVIGVARGGP